MNAGVNPAFSRHVEPIYGGDRTDVESTRQLLDAAEQVCSLVQHPGYGIVTALLDRERATVDRELDTGVVLAQAEYARAHGRRGALSAFAEAAEALIAKAESRQKDDAEPSSER